jgi:hypothetical protein
MRVATPTKDVQPIERPICLHNPGCGSYTASSCRVSPCARRAGQQTARRAEQTPNSMRKAPELGSLGAFHGPPNAEERGRKSNPSTRPVKRPLRKIAHAATGRRPGFRKHEGDRGVCVRPLLNSLLQRSRVPLQGSHVRCPIPPPRDGQGCAMPRFADTAQEQPDSPRCW